jgi:hypothetical protein
MRMLELLALFGLVIGVVLVVRRLRSKPASAPEVARSEVERWTEREVLRIFAARLDVGRATLEQAFSGQADPEVVREVEARVSSIDLAYERVAGPEKQLEARVEVSFEDGHVERASRRLAWAEVPQGVREELDRTGASVVYRPWLLPWQR